MTQNRSSAVMQQRTEAHDSLDDFPTPPWATRALLEFIDAHGIDVSGMSCREARLHDEAERAGDYARIDTTVLTAPSPKENDMARSRRKAADQVVEVMKPDFDLARRIYFNDIKPAISKQATHGQELSSAYKEISKVAHIQPQAAKLAFRLVEMEESKRDDFLRSFKGLCEVFRIFMPTDLVDQAEGKPADSNVVPIGDSPRPALATIPSDDSDLAGGPDEAPADGEHLEAAE